MCFTVSGALAYEFALSGKPGITFAPTFFNSLKCSFNIQKEHFFDGRTMDRIGEDHTGLGMSIDEYADFIGRHSHPEEVNEPEIAPRVLSTANVESLTEGLLLACEAPVSR